MAKTHQTVVDSLRVLVLNGTYEFRGQIMRDGTSYSVSGKTVTATIRNERYPGHTLHADYENISVTLGNSDTAASAGGVTFNLTPDSSKGFVAPPAAAEYENYLLQLYVSTDDYYPQLIRFGVRRQLD